MNEVASTPICVEIVDAIATFEGADSGDLTYALHDHIETEALEVLIADEGKTWELSFEVPKHTVTVKSDRTILVDGVEVR